MEITAPTCQNLSFTKTSKSMVDGIESGSKRNWPGWSVAIELLATPEIFDKQDMENCSKYQSILIKGSH